MTEIDAVETEDLVIKSKGGKEYTFKLPVPPKSFKNGKKLVAAAKRFVKANYTKQQECCRLLRHVKHVLEAPKVEWMNYEITYVKSRTWGWNPRCRVHLCGHYVNSGEPWGRFGNGTASGTGYDKPSAALEYALGDKDTSAAWTRLVVENSARLQKLTAGVLMPNIMSTPNKDSSCMPDLDIGGRGLKEFDRIMECLKWKTVNRVDGERIDYGEYATLKRK